MDTPIWYDDDAACQVTRIAKAGDRVAPAKPTMKSQRSLSDSEGTPKLSPSPHIFASPRKQARDDSSIRDSDHDHVGTANAARGRGGHTGTGEPAQAYVVSTPSVPVTPRRRAALGTRSGLSLQMPGMGSSNSSDQTQGQGRLGTPPPSAFARPASMSAGNCPPQSPKLPEHAAASLSPSVYASPPTGNLLPRRSRGLDFSRAATSLHHSTLAADQTSPESSPTIGSRAMNIPGGGVGHHGYKRRSGEYGMLMGGGLDPLWGLGAGTGERTIMASSLGSVSNMVSDASSSSEDDDFMDEDVDEAFITTPQITKSGPLPVTGARPSTSGSWIPGSPAVTGPLSFQQRQLRPRKRLRQRGPLAAGAGMVAAGASPASGAGLGLGLGLGLSRSPPGPGAAGMVMQISAPAVKEYPNPHSRRESISWAANQLHISGSESDENHKVQGETNEALMSTPSRDGSKVVRRVVTRRGNMLVSLFLHFLAGQGN
jgi:hypothetical protein